jgi:hypothetical protein
MSGLFNEASLVLVPSGYKAGKVYSQVPTNGDGDLTFTRASDATRVNSDGLIEVVGSGVPRLDYSQGSCPALLLEPQRTNNFTQSESFANYYVNRATATDLGTPSIFSSGSIARFTANSANAYFGKTILSVTSGSTYTVSGFFDLSEGIYAGISDTTNYRIFNLLTASVVGSGGGTLTISCKSTQIGSSNYYRIAFTFTATTTGTHLFVIGKSDGTVSTTNETVAAGYFQREDSASYATSYIPTTSATVTRLADSFSKTNIASLIGQTGGVIMLDFFYDIQIPSTELLFIRNGFLSYLYRARVSANGPNIFSILYLSSGGGKSFSPSVTLVPGNRYKIASVYNYATNTVKTFVNGSLIGTTVGVDPFPTASQNTVSSGDVLGQTFLKLQSLYLSTTIISDAEAEQLTTL